MSAKKEYLQAETSFRGQYSKSVFETLYFAYRPYFIYIVLLMIVGLIGRLSMMANANLIGVWVDSFCRAPAVCKAPPHWAIGFQSSNFIVVLVSLTVAGFLLTAFFRIAFSRISAMAVSQIYDEVTYRTSRLPMTFFDQNPVGRIVTRFSSDYGNVFRLFGGPLAELFAIVFDLISMVTLVSIASPYYIPIVVLIALLDYGIYRLNRSRMRRERRELSIRRSPSIAHFAESTQGASTIRIFGRQRVFDQRYLELNNYFLNQKLRTTIVLSLFSMQMTASTALLLLITGAAGFWLLQLGLVSIGSIGVAFTFVVLSGSSLQMFFDWMAQFEEAMVGVERLDEYLRRDLEPGLRLPAARKFPTPHPAYDTLTQESVRNSRMVEGKAAGISIKNLWFRYSPNLPHVLKGLDIEIKPGEKIGVVGRTGSGKSTLVQVLFRLYPVESGSITVDGREPDLSSNSTPFNVNSHIVDLSLYRRSIALISQEPILFRGTLRENLDFADQHSEQDYHKALQRVGLSGWFKGLKHGLDSEIEERGRNLSAGERQLLCLARCLLQDTPIVVMDEATSSVDPQSEEIMVRATREFFSDRTQIIIAHRLSTLKHCDRILWLHRGEIKMFDRPQVVIPIFENTALV